MPRALRAGTAAGQRGAAITRPTAAALLQYRYVFLLVAPPFESQMRCDQCAFCALLSSPLLQLSLDYWCASTAVSLEPLVAVTATWC